MADPTPDTSVFQQKYNEFVEDLLGALPEYTPQIQFAKSLDDATRLSRFRDEVKVVDTFCSEDFIKNPGRILPDVDIEDDVWSALSENTKKAIWEHVRILSICCFMEAGFKDDAKPSWMDDAMNEAMNEMKKKFEGVDFQEMIKKFMKFFKPEKSDKNAGDADDADDADDEKKGSPFDKLFENGFPKLPEKFLKGHLAKLAQEIVKDITPEDLGISPEMVAECEKDTSRAFNLLFSTFTNNPAVIQKTIGKIGKRLQQKIQSGAIRPQEIALEAEELMKEFSENTNFVEMMDGIKKAFGFEDMGMARKSGKEGSARLSMARERLRKKLDKKRAQQQSNQQQSNQQQSDKK